MKRSSEKKIIKQKKTANTVWLNNNDIIPSLLITAYIAVDFIPGTNTADVMGNQWLYLTIINISSIICISLTKKAEISSALKKTSRSTLSLLYTMLLIIAGISMAFAINKIESLVCYARFVNTFIMYVSLAILLYDRMRLFKLIAQVLAVILLIQSLSTLIEFFNGVGETEISTLIYSLKGNAANKNILAASLVLKIPFAIYGICYSRMLGKLMNVLILISGTLAIFILNARSAYLGVIIEILIFLVFYSILNRNKNTIRQTLYQTGSIVLPIIISFALSLVIIRKAISLQDEKTSYGTVIERLGSIRLTAEGSNARLALWSNAIDYIKNHPLKGSGFGNWKLVSIPYEKSFVDDLMVSYHVHNDFLEITSETGIPGGLLFLAIFICLSMYSLRTIFSKGNDSIRAISLIALMGISAYFIDAFFNFPMERPIMQFFFALLLAVALNCFLSTKKTVQEKPSGRPVLKIIFTFMSLLLLLPALYITFLTYKSLIAQTKVNRDMKKENPETKWQEIINIFPPIPNMNMYCFPISHIKAFYLMKDKKYDQALSLLNNNASVNPFLTLTEFFKAKIFFETNKTDSAFIYAKKAFFGKPRARSNYEILNTISIKLNDTTMLTQAFKEYTKYRNEPWAWNRYLEIMMSIQQNRQPLIPLADSAFKMFPDDPDLQQKKNILGNTNQPLPITKEQDDLFRNYFVAGLEAFTNNNYSIAIQNFTKAAKVNPGDYVAVENIGVCYFSMKEYSRAISYLDKVLQRKISTDGKAEFLKGVCLLNVGKKEEGCSYLNIANNKNYKDAKAYIQNNCTDKK